MDVQETSTGPLFIKLSTGSGDEYINFIYVVSVRIDHDASDSKGQSMTLHLTNGQYRTVMGEDARRLRRTLERLDSATCVEPEDEFALKEVKLKRCV